jgi:hypothetical protein
MLQAEDVFENNNLPIANFSGDIVVNVFQHPYKCRRDHKMSRDNDHLQEETMIVEEYE